MARFAGQRQLVRLFQGVSAYGSQVSGEYRFRRPAALNHRSGMRDALALGARPSSRPQNETGTGRKCLFLNIWTPAK